MKYKCEVLNYTEEKRTIQSCDINKIILSENSLSGKILELKTIKLFNSTS